MHNDIRQATTVPLLLRATLIAIGFILPAAALASTVQANENKSGFACNRLALSPEARKRHFDTLGPELRNRRMQVRELPDGFEFEFPSDPATVQIVSEWAAGERLCCPFFDIDLRFEHDSDRFWLRLTGSTGVKQFIKADFATWLKHAA